ncbi:MAG: hypothetical protein HFF84_12300 [Oscillibacter sp.]|nr:hypothetical protein [Oscillibacter sp.]
MSKFLDSNGLLYLWSKIKTYVDQHSGGTADSVAWENITGKPELALKSDLSSVYRFKGSVTNYASLPTEGSETGDVWNVEATGMNYAWTGETWDALGESFEIETITNAEIDAIVAEV